MFPIYPFPNLYETGASRKVFSAGIGTGRTVVEQWKNSG